jgi:hypothetical protein
LPVSSSNHDAPTIPLDAGYSPVMMDEVAAGVIDGKIVAHASW